MMSNDPSDGSPLVPAHQHGLDTEKAEDSPHRLLDEFIESAAQQAGISKHELAQQVTTMWQAGVRPVRGLSLAKILTAQDIVEMTNLQLGQINVNPQSITKEIAQRLPKQLCERLQVVPVLMTAEGVLVVASIKNLIESERADVSEAAQCPVDFRRSTRNAIIAAISHLDIVLADADEEAEDSSTARQRRSEQNYLKLVEGKDKASRLLGSLLNSAIGQNASDIHIYTEVLDGIEMVTTRLRISNDLRPHAQYPPNLGNAIFARFRQAGISASSLVGAFDGQYDITVPGAGRFDLRLNFIPIRDGMMLTIRLLPQERPALARLESLFPPQHSGIAELIKGTLGYNSGILILAGPTGSGKSTTLAAAVSYMVRPERKMVTIEDPVETLIPGAQQIPVTKHLTFALGLRAILRTDPDALMIGEIRDAETAGIAIEASQTGHMILTTLHAKNAVSAPARLIDMGVSKLQFTEEARLVIAQRLVKALCRNCSSAGQPVGCDNCENSGYKGRVALAETMIFDDEIKAAIENAKPPRFLKSSPGYSAFDNHAASLLDHKVTTVEQIRDALGVETVL